MKAVSIFGSPGTGKSTRLIEIINKLVTMTEPRNICLVSFTKAAAQEMADRCEQPIRTSTIHSMCFRLLELQRSMVVNRGELIKFGAEIGLEISWGNAQDEATEMTEGDEYVGIYDLARNRKGDLRTVFGEKGTLGSYDRFQYFVDSYENWKAENGLLDFTDMLSQVVERGLYDATAKVLLVDESQDLSPLQWDVVYNWCEKKLEVCYIAGDDDQAIFEWSGADPQGMMKFSDKYDSKVVILDKSWRVPKKVHTLANVIIKSIDDRLDKVYEPQPKDGEINRYGDFADVVHGINHLDDTLLLFRNHSLRKDIEEMMMTAGVPYLVDNGKPSPMEGKYGKLVLNWQKLQDGRNLKPNEMQALTAALDPRLKVKNNDVSEHLGLTWQQAIHDHWWSIMSYFEVVERKLGKSLLEVYEECELHLSTIHGAKGREADRVILINGMGQVTAESYSTDPDGEIRVFYVGVTRVKRQLDIVLGANPVGFLL